jgi:hypothetical protein
MLQNFQLRWDELQLLARLAADSLPESAASGTQLLLLREVVLDTLAGQLGWQFIATATAPGVSLNGCFHHIQRWRQHFHRGGFEQRQLIWIEPLAAGAKSGPHELGYIVFQLCQLVLQIVDGGELFRDQRMTSSNIVR